MKKEEIKFEQYKIMIDSAEKNSDKRIQQNNIYLTINLAFLSYILTLKNLPQIIITSVIGIAICIIWFLSILNYCKRNKVKFDIINEIEEEFGLLLFKEEWKRISVLTSLSIYERIISVIFIIIYIALPIINLF